MTTSSESLAASSLPPYAEPAGEARPCTMHDRPAPFEGRFRRVPRDDDERVYSYLGPALRRGLGGG